MAKRNWTEEDILRTKASSEKTPAINKANGNPATRYTDAVTGRSMVVDDVTGAIVQLGDTGFLFGKGSGDVVP